MVLSDAIKPDYLLHAYSVGLAGPNPHLSARMGARMDFPEMPGFDASIDLRG